MRMVHVLMQGSHVSTGNTMLVWGRLNNDCGHPSWPALAGTNDSHDDGDGLSECAGDCDDAEARAWGPAGEVGDFSFFLGGTVVSWGPAQAGGQEFCYDLYRTENAADLTGTVVCLELVDCDDPSGVGSWGNDSAGNPRVVNACQ